MRSAIVLIFLFSIQISAQNLFSGSAPVFRRLVTPWKKAEDQSTIHAIRHLKSQISELQAESNELKYYDIISELVQQLLELLGTTPEEHQENSDQDSEEGSSILETERLTIPVKQVFVPGVRVLTKDSDSGRSSSTASSSEGATDSSNGLGSSPFDLDVQQECLEFPAASYQTPCFTPVASTPIPVQNDWIGKVKRVFRSLNRWARGILAFKRAGMEPLLMSRSHLAELAPGHPFVSDHTGAVAFRQWRESDNTASFVGTREAQRLSEVRYLDTVQRLSALIQIQAMPGHNARLYDFQGRLLTNAKLIFVMSSNGTLFVGRDIQGEFHHSSLAAGGPVLWAGELKTNQEGEIIYLSNESGHYKPAEYHTLLGLEQLERQGIDLFKVTIEWFDKFDEIQYNALMFKEFLKNKLD